MFKKQGVVDRFENNTAIVLVEGHKMLIPINLLPDGIHEGQTLWITINNNERAEHDRETVAHELIKTLLQREAP